MDTFTEIKNKLSLIESVLLEENNQLEIENKINEIINKMNELNTEQREYVIGCIKQIKNEISKKKNVFNELSESGNSETFYRGKNKKMDDYISDTLDNLSSLRKQKKLLNKTKISLRKGRESISHGIEYLKMMKERHGQDFWLFVCGMSALIVFVLFVWYYF